MRTILIILLSLTATVQGWTGSYYTPPINSTNKSYTTTPNTTHISYPIATNSSPSFTGNIFVSSKGSDSNNGFTTNTSLLTLAKAKMLVQAKIPTQAQNITVKIMDTLVVTSALSLTSADSPKNGFSNTWSGGTLFAGTYITNWTAVGASIPGAYKATYTGPSVRSITLNDERRFRIRNGQFMPALTLTASGYTGATGTALAGDPNPTNIEFIYQIFQFSESRNVVTNITGNNINMLNGTHLLITQSWGTNAALVNIENLWNNFTNYARQATFYADTAHSLIYYYPRPTENMTTAIVIAPNETVESAITENGVTNVTLLGINTPYTAWDIHKHGFCSIAQAMYWKLGITTNMTQVDGNTNLMDVPAAIYLNNCTNCNIIACNVSHCDSTGITRTFGCNNCIAVSNVVRDVAYNGMTIGEWSECTNSPRAYCNAVHTWTNYITQVGQLASGGNCIVEHFAKNTHVDFNTLTEAPYCGICFGIGLAGYTNIQATIGGDTIVANRIFNVCTVQQDGACVYPQAPTGFGGAGLVIAYNWLSRARKYDIPYGGFSYPTAGIYPDSGSSMVNVFSNIIDGCNQAINWNFMAQEPNIQGTNFSDTANVFYATTPPANTVTNYPSPNVNPIVTQYPAWNQPTIANAAGAGLLVPSPSVNWDSYVASLAPVVWYKQNDTTTIMIDYSGNSLNAIMSGSYSQSQSAIAPGISRNTTLYSGGLGISTANSQVNIGGFTPFSVVSLIKPNITRNSTFATYQVQQAQDSIPTSAGWEFVQFNNGNGLNPFNSAPIAIDMYNNASTGQHMAVVGGTDLTNGGPWLLVATWTGADDPADLKLYVNGFYEVPCTIANALGGAPANTTPLKIGNGYQGTEGDSMFFNYVLTPHEIHNLSDAAQVSFK